MSDSTSNNTPNTEQASPNTIEAGTTNTTDSNRNSKNKCFEKQGNKNKVYKNFSDLNEQRNWEGEEPKVGGVLGLRSEWLDKKVSFEVFLEKTTDYILQEFTNPRDIVGSIRDMKDPLINFKKHNLP
jgi:hypothetical protein